MKKNFLARKSVYDITRFTTLDYKDHLACIIWFVKCNMRCSYCYNSRIVEGEGILSNQEVFEFLKSRVGKLDGVVLSGGECTLNPDLLEICKEIKELGFKVKIDTNGLNPKLLFELIDFGLVDFIALDYKAPIEKFEQITKVKSSKNFYKTLDMLIEKSFPFEVRTTVHSSLLNENDINSMAYELNKRGYIGTYYLQNYLHVEDTFDTIPQYPVQIDKNLLNNTINIEFRN